jgi:serine/threonine-protein kinase
MDTTHTDLAGQASRPAGGTPIELRRLGEFQILRKLGEGGMGAVYLAYHEGQQACFAVKVLADSLAFNQNYVDRFYREARSGTALNHPNIVRCLTVGQDQATMKHYMVMEYVDGSTAQVLLEAQGKLPLGDAVHIVLDVARALEHAHSRNIVHRDIKPGNILITRSGVAKLADLGLAKRMDEASSLTATRQSFGTPHYMPYEQAMNSRNADNRSDIFALGATLYHLVTGELPFPGENHVDVAEKKSLGVYAPASAKVSVPRALDLILAKMLARNPKHRFQTASELIVVLERSQLSAPVPSFADPALALSDPCIRALLAVDDQPTKTDMTRARRRRLVPAGADSGWLLRYQDATGKVKRYRATTEQITRHLRAGRLPGNMEARRLERNAIFQPLPTYPEFEAVIAAKPSVPKRRKLDPAPAPQKPAAREFSVLDTGRLIMIIIAMSAFCGLVWVVWHLLH